MYVTYEQLMNILLERTIENKKMIKRSIEQRRNGMEDLYGVCFSANGDADHPATFYISLSPDYGYLSRFAFKLVIGSYASSVSGVSGGSMSIGDTSLSVNASSGAKMVSGTSTVEDDSNGGSVSPDPHTHSVSGSVGGLTYNMKYISTASDNWEMSIDGVDVTDYLIEQHGGDWIEGEGVYPTNDLDDEIADFYDILDVASMITAEAESEDDPDEQDALLDMREQLLRRGFKKVEIRSDAPFSVDAYLYVKYSHVQR